MNMSPAMLARAPTLVFQGKIVFCFLDAKRYVIVAAYLRVLTSPFIIIYTGLQKILKKSNLEQLFDIRHSY